MSPSLGSHRRCASRHDTPGVEDLHLLALTYPSVYPLGPSEDLPAGMTLHMSPSLGSHRRCASRHDTPCVDFLPATYSYIPVNQWGSPIKYSCQSGMRKWTKTLSKDLPCELQFPATVILKHCYRQLNHWKLSASYCYLRTDNIQEAVLCPMTNICYYFIKHWKLPASLLLP